MRKFVCAVVCTFALVGFVVAEEFPAFITGFETKDGKTTVNYIKGKKKGEEGTKASTVMAKDCKVVKGTYDKDNKKWVVGDAIEGGIKADMFKDVSTEKGVNGVLTVADDGASKGQVTQILIGKKGKKN